MSKPKLGLQNKTPDEIVAMTNVIITAMTGNANFTTPNPTLASVTTLKTTAATKIAAYNSSLAATDTALADRDAAIAALSNALTLLAAYVENASGGDAVKIESAGMDVRNPATPIGPMPQVQNLVVEASEFEGKVDVSWAPPRGAICFELQSSEDPNTPASWVLKDVSARSATSLNSFASGSKVWVRVRAVGAENNKGPWSDPAAKIVP